MTQYVWLIWSSILLIPWLAIYIFANRQIERREMLIVSLVTSLFGLTEPFFVPEYWSPPSLFNLALRTGFDIESLIFAFAAGGIVFAIYQVIFKKRHENISEKIRHSKRHKLHYVVIASVPVIIFLLYLATNLNPIYIFMVAGTLGSLLALYCRPDLKKKMFTSAVTFLALYYVYFLVLITTWPDYVEAVWNISALSGILITNVPLEELLFAFIFGFYWSALYEHLTWKKLKTI